MALYGGRNVHEVHTIYTKEKRQKCQLNLNQANK